MISIRRMKQKMESSIAVLGINRRNLEYIQEKNPRHNYANADDKVLAKDLLTEYSIPVPETISVVRARHEVESILSSIPPGRGFAIKPSRGFGGTGILIARESEAGIVDTKGLILRREDLSLHVNSILAGMFSLDHVDDHALIEGLVSDDEALSSIHGESGVSDIRVVAHEGQPLMAMLRMPCAASDGKANLHQHGIGLGLDLDTGRTIHAIQDERSISVHPDTLRPLSDVQIPEWGEILSIASRANAIFGLDYLGVDIVIDAQRGPLVLEVNVRPGLAIQLANKMGLRRILEIS